MTPFQWKVVGVGVLVYVGLIAFRCAVFTNHVRLCMRTDVQFSVATVAHIGAWFLGSWLGVEAAKKSGRPWVGWVAGIAAVVTFAALLFWLGFDLPGGDEFDDDNNYRR